MHQHFAEVGRLRTPLGIHRLGREGGDGSGGSWRRSRRRGGRGCGRPGCGACRRRSRGRDRRARLRGGGSACDGREDDGDRGERGGGGGAGRARGHVRHPQALPYGEVCLIGRHAVGKLELGDAHAVGLAQAIQGIAGLHSVTDPAERRSAGHRGFGGERWNVNKGTSRQIGGKQAVSQQQIFRRALVAEGECHQVIAWPHENLHPAGGRRACGRRRDGRSWSGR